MASVPATYLNLLSYADFTSLAGLAAITTGMGTVPLWLVGVKRTDSVHLELAKPSTEKNFQRCSDQGQKNCRNVSNNS